jgi:hypothetical protein
LLSLLFEGSTPLFGQINSKLSEGKWLKIGIKESGFYKIDYNWLLKNQIDPSTIKPKNVGIYSQGNNYLPQKNSASRPKDLPTYSCYFYGENDSKWDKEDYLIFYGENPNKKKWNPVKNRIETDINPYTDSTYYFLKIDDSNPERIKSKILQSGKSPYIDYGYFDYHFEPELINLLQSGRQWLGPSFASNTNNKISYFLPDYKNGISSLLYGKLANGSINRGEFTFQIPNNTLPILPIEGINNSRYDIKAITKEFEWKVTPELKNSTWEWYLTYNNSSGTGYIDHISLIYPKRFNAKSTLTNYWLPNQVDSVFSINILNLEKQHEIWLLENGNNWTRFENPIENPEISCTKQTQIFIFNPNEAPNPSSLVRVSNQNLRQHLSSTLLIVTSKPLLVAGKKYADYKNSKTKISASTVSTDEIYHEFSSGKTDPTAIRDFIKFLKNTPNSKLKYVLLLGDASVDFKGINSVTPEVEKKALVPTYQSRESFHPLLSYCTDDYFGILGDNDGELSEEEFSANESINIAIGRIPARNSEEANMMINKFISYSESKNNRNYKNYTFSWVADDGDYNLHIQDSEDFEQILKASNEVYTVKKVYLDQYPQEINNGYYTSKAAQKETIDLFNKNADFIHYVGHGAENGWTDEKIITTNELIQLKNSQHLPILLTATCQFGRFDNPNQSSGAEIALLSNKGGSIGLISTSRPVFQSSNYLFGKNFYRILNEHKNDPNYKLGDLFKDTKNVSQAGVINRNIVLLGDPSLDIPWQYITGEINTIIVKPKGSGKITGNIPTQMNENGLAELSIYEMSESQKTLGTKTPTYAYERDGKLLFTSRISIKKGQFELSERGIPPINTENAIIRLVANLENGSKVMASKKVQIIKAEIITDNSPPKIQYELVNETDMNNCSKNPILKINLSDDTGFSFWGANGEKTEIIVNDTLHLPLLDYFQSELNTPNQGIALIPFENLTNGEYKISLTCWDNSYIKTNQTFTFRVNENNTANEKWAVFPNPTTDNANFEWTTKERWTDFEYHVSLFDLSGQKIHESNSKINSNNTGKLTIQLPLEKMGNKTFNSTILYNITITNVLNRSNNQFSGKIIVAK